MSTHGGLSLNNLNKMTLQEMQDLMGQMLQVQRQLQESQLQADNRLTRVEAISESNARAIEALGGKVSDLITIVGQFATAPIHAWAS
jgi:hypothetical protein